MQYKNIKTNEFDYHLPEHFIAKYPLELRNHSKLLIYKDKNIYEKKFLEIHEEIPSNYLLILNDTKVIPARLFLKKDTGATIEIFLLEPYKPNNYWKAFNSTKTCQWTCLIGNAKKWKEETHLHLELKVNYVSVILTVEKIQKFNDAYIVQFSWNNDFTFIEIITAIGQIPIAPYLKRNTEPIDYERYQTIFSKVLGSVAAPTASLHFTNHEFENLEKKNIKTEFLTLHVGAGTFKPMTTTYVHEHELHSETFIFKQSLLEKIINHYPNIIAVGTTSLRALESIYHVANLYSSYNQLITFISQWCEYEYKNHKDTLVALKNFNAFMQNNKIMQLEVKTQLMISPGYKIKMVKGLITNFHQPKSSLLVLVATLVSENWKKIYEYALNNNFRFLSYGDSSLLWID